MGDNELLTLPGIRCLRGYVGLTHAVCVIKGAIESENEINIFHLLSGRLTKVSREMNPYVSIMCGSLVASSAVATNLRQTLVENVLRRGQADARESRHMERGSDGAEA